MFRSARELLRLSQEQVATLTASRHRRLSRAAISDIERGRNLPNLEALVSLSAALHLDPSEILERIRLDPAVSVDLSGLSMAELRERAKTFYWAGDYRAALATCDAMVDLVALDPPRDETERRRILARLEIDRALALRRSSALRAAEASAKRAVELSAETKELQVQAYLVLASLHAQEGYFVQARVAAGEALRLSRDEGPLLQAQAWSQQGSALHASGDFRGARDAFLEARKRVVSTGDHHTLLNIEGNIGSCLVELGQTAHARKCLVRAVDLARKHGNVAMEASWLVELGGLALLEGNLDEAETCARAAAGIARLHNHYLTHFRAEWLQHRIALARHPGARDTPRIRSLTRLYARVKEHRGIDAVRDYEASMIDYQAAPEVDGD